MSKDKIENLLAMNNVNKEEFEKKLYNTLLLGVFEAICKDINKANNKIEVKENFRKSTDRIAVTKRMVKKYVGCSLTEEEYRWIADLLTAFFRTGDARKRYDEEFRQVLMDQQDGQCTICGKKISVRQSHLDHIIPWNYVGDNLENNLQLLCETCNARKGAATYYEVSMLLLNKSE